MGFNKIKSNQSMFRKTVVGWLQNSRNDQRSSDPGKKESDFNSTNDWLGPELDNISQTGNLLTDSRFFSWTLVAPLIRLLCR